jgi:hypothetical protein
MLPKICRETIFPQNHGIQTFIMRHASSIEPAESLSYRMFSKYRLPLSAKAEEHA